MAINGKYLQWMVMAMKRPLMATNRINWQFMDTKLTLIAIWLPCNGNSWPFMVIRYQCQLVAINGDLMAIKCPSMPNVSVERPHLPISRSRCLVSNRSRATHGRLKVKQFSVWVSEQVCKAKLFLQGWLSPPLPPPYKVGLGYPKKINKIMNRMSIL